MNSYLPVLLEILGAVLCVAAGVCFGSGSGSPFAIAGMFSVGLALIFWRRYRSAAYVCGGIGLVLACAGEVHEFVRGQESFWSFALWAGNVFILTIAILIERRWVRKHRVEQVHHDAIT